MVKTLTNWEEIVGTLCEFNPLTGLLRIDNMALTLNVEDQTLANQLNSLIGLKIGILLTDIPSKPCLVRVVEK